MTSCAFSSPPPVELFITALWRVNKTVIKAGMLWLLFLSSWSRAWWGEGNFLMGPCPALCCWHWAYLKYLVGMSKLILLQWESEGNQVDRLFMLFLLDSLKMILFGCKKYRYFSSYPWETKEVLSWGVLRWVWDLAFASSLGVETGRLRKMWPSRGWVCGGQRQRSLFASAPLAGCSFNTSCTQKMTAAMDKSQDKVLEKSDKSGHHQSPVGQGTKPPCRHIHGLHWDPLYRTALPPFTSEKPLWCAGEWGVGWAGLSREVEGSKTHLWIIPAVYFSTKIALESAKQQLGTFLCIQGRDWSVCIGPSVVAGAAQMCSSCSPWQNSRDCGVLPQ